MSYHNPGDYTLSCPSQGIKRETGGRIKKKKNKALCLIVIWVNAIAGNLSVITARE